MKSVLKLVSAATILCSLATARKSYLVKEEHAGRIPKIRATDYPKYTYF